ncbi:restriction endonuclease subunit S [Citrobacter freundii]|uniref:restriction endonuclease subunit S n=1 Tax=Citrobacter sp. Cf087 TaxID=2985054 RepID=UPI0007B41C61|nr:MULTISPECIES: restriction endonuclease subunit S [Citrobacter]EIJ9081937.1 restriction endonuclease subunit S [Citrobacter freundii]EJH9547974.1 restriction endonuclease subunit S [Citrobacter freundii]EJO6483230.1 restriction endonuclease subunit S [Citrobacter freundii]EKW5686330.1 restriction endonuclease subunit S [Citrobacter freundii]EKX5706003.1 restriction endonuclease subunit S [Citrobacter freundii]
MNSKLLPETWQTKLAIDCFDQISTTNSKVKSKDCSPEGLYPVIDQGQNYISGYINDDSKVIKVDSPICIFGDHTRIVKWVTHDFVPGADGTKLLQPKAFIHPRYAYYSLCALNIPDKGYSRHFKYFKELEINLPGRLEQKIIAEKLDTLLTQVDCTKARLEQIPQILKRFRQAVLEDAVSGRLTENWRDARISEESAEELLVNISKTRKKNLTSGTDSLATESKRYIAKIDAHHFNIPDIILPVGWKWTTFLQSMEKVVDCHNKTAPYTEEGIYLIRTPDIRNGIISLKNTKYVNEDTYNFWSKRCPPKSGDIIFTREAPMGEAGIVPENTLLCMGQRMMLLRPIQSYLNNKYVLLNILSISFQARMMAQAIGTGVKHLRVADVESLMYPLPPLPEQHEIVRRVEQLFAYADTIEKQVNSALTRVNNLTQSILAKAFRGELTAQWRAENPELISGENSAAALLEKIKAERAASGGKKASRKKA